MIRFYALWAIVSAAFGVWFYVVDSNEKKEIKTIVLRTILAASAAAATIAALYLVNNISGL